MRPHVIVLCAAVAAATSATVLHAAPAAPTVPAALPAPQAVSPPQAVLAKDTPIRLRLEMDLRSGRDKAGEPVSSP